MGVPVSASFERAGMRRSSCGVKLLAFLMACASSRTMRSHDSASSASTSRTAVP